MKTVNQTSGKGYLEINFEEGIARITEITRDDEVTYDFFEILSRYNNKHVNFSIKEENPLDPVLGDEE